MSDGDITLTAWRMPPLMALAVETTCQLGSHCGASGVLFSPFELRESVSALAGLMSAYHRMKRAVMIAHSMKSR